MYVNYEHNYNIHKQIYVITLLSESGVIFSIALQERFKILKCLNCKIINKM